MIDPNNPPLEPGEEEEEALLGAEQPTPEGPDAGDVTMSQLSIADMMREARSKSIRTAKVEPAPKSSPNWAQKLSGFFPRHRNRQVFVTRILTVTIIFSILQFLYNIIAFSVGGITDISSNRCAGPSSKALTDFGAKDAWLIHQMGQVHRFITPAFLFGGIFDLIVGMCVQIYLGAFMCEERWGALKLAVIYLLSAIFSNIGSALWSPGSISVGASAAFAGVIGGRISDLICIYGEPVIEADPRRYRERTRVLFECLGGLVLLFIFGDRVLGNTPVDTYGQIAGLVVGLLVGFGIFGVSSRHMIKRFGLALSSWVGLVVGAIFILVQFFAGKCEGCVRG